MATDPEFINRVLEATAGDCSGHVYWELENGEIRFWVLCNDTFFWGTGDGEDITPENVHLLEEASKELAAFGEQVRDFCLTTLFAAKVRKMRPQGALYKYLDEETWPLFDACGPERDVGLGNPEPHPLERRS